MFGRGFGEAICVHIGQGRWVVVDSCLNPQVKAPAALAYFDRIGVDPSTAVELIVATHWDDDHIGGITRVAEECSSARVALSLALRTPDFVQFVVSQAGTAGAVGSGVDEIRGILQICAARGTSPLWAQANRVLYPPTTGDAPVVVALSPSDDSVQRTILNMIEQATGLQREFARRFTVPEGPNGGSIVTLVTSLGANIILGADLEVASNPDAGWNAVFRDAKPAQPISLMKVPHHGSKGAHHDDFWAQCVHPHAVAILSPWVRGGNSLPKQRDLDRLISVAGRTFLTAMPAPRKSEMPSEVRNLVRKLRLGQEVRTLIGWGQVRARKSMGDEDWRVDLDGDATQVH